MANGMMYFLILFVVNCKANKIYRIGSNSILVEYNYYIFQLTHFPSNLYTPINKSHRFSVKIEINNLQKYIKHNKNMIKSVLFDFIKDVLLRYT
jgi:hypothetical protein